MMLKQKGCWAQMNINPVVIELRCDGFLQVTNEHPTCSTLFLFCAPSSVSLIFSSLFFPFAFRYCSSKSQDPSWRQTVLVPCLLPFFLALPSCIYLRMLSFLAAGQRARFSFCLWTASLLSETLSAWSTADIIKSAFQSLPRCHLPWGHKCGDLPLYNRHVSTIKKKKVWRVGVEINW